MDNGVFKTNGKFFGLKGILTRRDFVVNALIILTVESILWMTPFFYLVIYNPKFLGSIMSARPGLPTWAYIWLFLDGIFTSAMYFPSIVRRIRDILGEDDDNKIFTTSAILSVIILAGYTPLAVYIGKWMSFAVIIFLMTIKGKISAAIPQNELLKFNWGAFFGTWIWGLFNRVPKTAIILPLFLTYGWFPFMLVCGMRGNEWAFEAKKEQFGENKENFHKSQSDQAIIWTAISPFLFVIGFLAITFLTGVVMMSYSKSYPQIITKLENITKEYQKVSVETNFTKIELGETENKFFMEPEIWTKLPLRYKKQLLESAAVYANEKDGKTSVKYPFITDTMNKTKIYSTFNNEILAEFYVDPSEYAKMTTAEKSEAFKIATEIRNKGFKINDYPSVP